MQIETISVNSLDEADIQIDVVRVPRQWYVSLARECLDTHFPELVDSLLPIAETISLHVPGVWVDPDLGRGSLVGEYIIATYESGEDQSTPDIRRRLAENLQLWQCLADEVLYRENGKDLGFFNLLFDLWLDDRLSDEGPDLDEVDAVAIGD